MHIQARATPAASPPDLETFLAILSEPEPPREPINIEGVSGDDLETGGSFTFSFDHNRESHVRAWLEEKGYTVQFLEGNMGEIENPYTRQFETNLDIARQNIDILAMLHQKTKGNLTQEEASFLDQVVPQLQMLYVRKAG